jgi:hypothetical protein
MDLSNCLYSLRDAGRIRDGRRLVQRRQFPTTHDDIPAKVMVPLNIYITSDDDDDNDDNDSHKRFSKIYQSKTLEARTGTKLPL